MGSRLLTAAEADVLREREKQRAKWDSFHDDDLPDGQLADVAAFLAHSHYEPELSPEWGRKLYHKHRNDRRRQLVIAAALCIAEAERLDRLEAREGREETDHG